jgi:hypothetical protein
MIPLWYFPHSRIRLNSFDDGPQANNVTGTTPSGSNRENNPKNGISTCTAFPNRFTLVIGTYSGSFEPDRHSWQR